MGFVVDKVALGAGFLRVLRFLLPTFIPQITPKSPSYYHLGLVQQASSGRITKWTQSHLTKKKK
jgi:hypothetical protein